MSSISFLGLNSSQRPAPTEREHATSGRLVDDALLQATADSLAQETSLEKLGESWEKYRKACRSTNVPLDKPLHKSVILKSMLAEGKLQRLALASRGVDKSCGGVNINHVGVKQDAGDLMNSYYLNTLGGPRGDGTDLIGQASVNKGPSRGIVHAPFWTAFGQFHKNQLVGDITFLDGAQKTSSSFKGEAKLSDDLSTWAFLRGELHRHTEQGCVVEQGSFNQQNLFRGSRRWSDGTQVTAFCLAPLGAIPEPLSCFFSPFYARYAGEGSVCWSDDVIHHGNLQMRDLLTSSDNVAVQRYILTGADDTTVYFSLTQELKPDLSTRRVITPSLIDL